MTTPFTYGEWRNSVVIGGPLDGQYITWSITNGEWPDEYGFAPHANAFVHETLSTRFVKALPIQEQP